MLRRQRCQRCQRCLIAQALEFGWVSKKREFRHHNGYDKRTAYGLLAQPPQQGIPHRVTPNSMQTRLQSPRWSREYRRSADGLARHADNSGKLWLKNR